MKFFLLVPLLLVFISPVNAFWGLSEEEKKICRDRASRERNEFSAKQTYKYCSKNIKSELRKAKERNKKYERWYREVGKNGCLKEKFALDRWKKKKGNEPSFSLIWDLNACEEKLEKSKKEYGL